MKRSFYENPLQEGRLQFRFSKEPGATRYDKWTSHTQFFAKCGKKAVDFLLQLFDENVLIITEIKDFKRIDKKGRYKNGRFSMELCTDVAQKIVDTISALDKPEKLKRREEQDFAKGTGRLARKAVFHWEMKDSVRTDVRKQQLMNMTKALKSRLHALGSACTHVKVSNIRDYPVDKKWWTVTRIQK